MKELQTGKDRPFLSFLSLFSRDKKKTCPDLLSRRRSGAPAPVCFCRCRLSPLLFALLCFSLVSPLSLLPWFVDMPSVVGSSPASLPGGLSSGAGARRVRGRSVSGLFREFSEISLRSGQIYFPGGPSGFGGGARGLDLAMMMMRNVPACVACTASDKLGESRLSKHEDMWWWQPLVGSVFLFGSGSQKPHHD
ncbi:hypothetical protein Bca101_067270 [Brassica carinata]